MEYQKIANLLNDESNKPSKFRTRNWIEINDESRGEYSSDKLIRFKAAMLRSGLCDYSVYAYIYICLQYICLYILIKRNITVNNTAVEGAAATNTNKKAIFKNCAPFTNCTSKINNTQIVDDEHVDIVMSM